jgi:hypothetical protein
MSLLHDRIPDVNVESSKRKADDDHDDRDTMMNDDMSKRSRTTQDWYAWSPELKKNYPHTFGECSRNGPPHVLTDECKYSQEEDAALHQKMSLLEKAQLELTRQNLDKGRLETLKLKLEIMEVVKAKQRVPEEEALGYVEHAMLAMSAPMM